MNRLEIALVAACLGAACAADIPDEPHAARPSPQRADSVAPAAQESAPTPTLAWEPCRGAFECATLRVPRDYADPDAGTIALAVMRLKAAGDRVGSLVVNPGGPGVSALSYLEAAAPHLSQVLHGRFDLVAFDPRGVGASTPIDCHAAAFELAAVDSSPDDDAEWTLLEQVAERFADDCATKHAALLPHLGTPNVARDMDRLRAALGDEQLTYLGFSYGSVIGAWYAELFPQRVRAMVLDGGVDVHLSLLERSRTQVINFERNLSGYLAWCAAQPAQCAWTQGKPPRQALEALASQVDRQPLRTSVPGRVIGPGELTLGMAVLLSIGGEPLWPTLSALLGAAVLGDGTGFVGIVAERLGRNPDPDNPNLIEAEYAVSCADDAAPPLATLREEAARFAREAPFFGPMGAAQLAVCSQWPSVAPRLPKPRGRGAPPILVIGTTGDPVTPYAWSEALAEQLETAVLMTWEGTTHTVFGHGVPCIDEPVRTYLLSGLAPASDVRCARP